MDFSQFQASLSDKTPPDVSPPLQALWLDGKGDWAGAHDRLQDQDDRDGAWVHAYLHRKEGDAMNAGYWYRRAGRPAVQGTLDEEWEVLVCTLLRGQSGL